jgi:Lysylphosphatidylglycerol synthase TM region
MNEPPTPNPESAIEPPPTKRRVWMILVQLIGFAGGIGALWWAVRLAMSEENRDQLSRLSDASPIELLALMALATISVGFNGIIFWVLINPVHRLRATDVISTNAIATFLAYLPFKLSVVSRFVIHNRRDKVPVLTIGAWILAEALLMMAVFVPMGVMSWWQQEANLLWWIGSLVSIALATLAGCWVARRLAGERGIDWLAKIMGKRLTGTDSFARLHSGFVMLGNTRAAMIANAFRVLDILAFALRFYVAARVLDLPISPSDSLLLGATYFMIGAASPFGMLGTREAGTIAIASLIGISSAAITEDQSGTVPIAATVLFVTAVEAVVNLGCAGFGIAWLRARPGLPIAPQADGEDESDQVSGV